MRDFIFALILAVLLVGCNATTRVKYETPDKNFELEHYRDSLEQPPLDEGPFIGPGHVPSAPVTKYLETDIDL